MKPPKKKIAPCKKHRFEFSYHTGFGAQPRRIYNKWLKRKVTTKPLTFGFRCSVCQESIERPATAGERKFHTKYGNSLLDSKTRHIHTVWHDFMKRFMKDLRFKHKGMELMDAIAEWAKKWPEDVRILSIDDSHHCSSDLVLIEHRTPNSYMGTTAIVIPQCSGEDPVQFFLYPEHLKSLLNALRAIKKATRPIKQRERRQDGERRRLTRKNIRHPAVI